MAACMLEIHLRAGSDLDGIDHDDTARAIAQAIAERDDVHAVTIEEHPTVAYGTGGGTR